VSSFNSLTSNGSSNALLEPLDVSELNENTESQLVRISDLNLLDQTEWKANGNSFNVRASNGIREFTISIDNDCELSTVDPPAGVFHMTGIGGQFDSSAPYTDNYQLFPRYAADLDLADQVINDTGINLVKAFPNPMKRELHIEIMDPIMDLYLLDAFGRKVRTIADLENGVLNVQDLHQGIYLLQANSKRDSYSLRVLKID